MAANTESGKMKARWQIAIMGKICIANDSVARQLFERFFSENISCRDPSVKITAINTTALESSKQETHCFILARTLLSVSVVMPR
jgi:hypothetical protein